MNLFTEGELRSVLEGHRVKMKEEVEGIPGNQFLNTSPEDLIQFLAKKFSIEPLILHEDRAAIEPFESKMDVSHDRMRRFLSDTHSGPILVDATRYELHVPFSGEGDLFKFRPDQFHMGGCRGRIIGTDLVITHETDESDPEVINRGLEQVLRNIQSMVGWSNTMVSSFNSILPVKARALVESRRNRLLQAASTASSLKFPVRPRSGEAGTYTIPTVKKRVIPVLPVAPNTIYKPDPTIDMGTYEDILRTLRNMSLTMERSPSTFKGMDEEAIRTVLLVGLNGAFEGEATGETFNGAGKTDILIRHQGENLFIAECKIWKGPKKYSEAIDQLMGYVTWRDTKTALLVFNKGVETTKVLEGAKETMGSHPRFKRFETPSAVGNLRAILGQERDVNREVLVEVMVFDVPRT